MKLQLKRGWKKCHGYINIPLSHTRPATAAAGRERILPGRPGKIGIHFVLETWMYHNWYQGIKMNWTKVKVSFVLMQSVNIVKIHKQFMFYNNCQLSKVNCVDKKLLINEKYRSQLQSIVIDKDTIVWNNIQDTFTRLLLVFVMSDSTKIDQARQSIPLSLHLSLWVQTVELSWEKRGKRRTKQQPTTAHTLTSL